jgi:hypothetical protein
MKSKLKLSLRKFSPYDLFERGEQDISMSMAGQKIVKAVKRFTALLMEHPLMFKGQRIVGLCKLLTVYAINF